jgi:hypothetical protein
VADQDVRAARLRLRRDLDDALTNDPCEVGAARDHLVEEVLDREWRDHVEFEHQRLTGDRLLGFRGDDDRDVGLRLEEVLDLFVAAVLLGEAARRDHLLLQLPADVGVLGGLDRRRQRGTAARVGALGDHRIDPQDVGLRRLQVFGGLEPATELTALLHEVVVAAVLAERLRRGVVQRARLHVRRIELHRASREVLRDLELTTLERGDRRRHVAIDLRTATGEICILDGAQTAQRFALGFLALRAKLGVAVAFGFDQAVARRLLEVAPVDVASDLDRHDGAAKVLDRALEVLLLARAARGVEARLHVHPRALLADLVQPLHLLGERLHRTGTLTHLGEQRVQRDVDARILRQRLARLQQQRLRFLGLPDLTQLLRVLEVLRDEELTALAVDLLRILCIPLREESLGRRREIRRRTVRRRCARDGAEQGGSDRCGETAGVLHEHHLVRLGSKDRAAQAYANGAGGGVPATPTGISGETATGNTHAHRLLDGIVSATSNGKSVSDSDEERRSGGPGEAVPEGEGART